MMRRASPSLHVVSAKPAADDDARAPEDMLAFLFAREAALLADLREVRRQQDVHRVRYSKAQGLRIFAGLEVLRQQFGPEAGR